MNLKTLKLIINLLAILFVTNSCKKSDKLKPGSVDLNGVYQISNAINISPLKMYTMNGEITDQAVIKDYVKRSHDSSFFTFDKTTIPSDFGESEIDFGAAGSATWTGTLPPPNLSDPEVYFPYTTPTNYTISQRSSDGFVLEALDSTKMFPKGDHEDNRARMLFDNSNSLKEISNCGPVICAGNTCSSNCTFRTAYPFAIKDGTIYLQLYACSIKCSSGTSASSIGESQMVGSFDMALIHQLIPGDTVLFQNRTIQFNKK